jgi:predicted transcriptional regulator
MIRIYVVWTNIAREKMKAIDEFFSDRYIHLMSKVTDALRSARKEAGIRQRALASMLGITPQFLADIERGRRELMRRHYANLPDQIRRKVIAAAIDEYRDAIAELRKMR